MELKGRGSVSSIVSKDCCFCLILRRKNNTTKAKMSAPAIPPITPPTIAPMMDFLLGFSALTESV
jgi:hypothetical protein